jgi:hypothetical protein
MNVRSVIFFICLIVFVGSASMIANSLYPTNQTILIATVALTASIALFIALVAETMTSNIVSAVVNKNLEDQTSLLSAVIGKTLYKVLKDEKEKENQLK